MLSSETSIFASFHISDRNIVTPVMEQIRVAGWYNIVDIGTQTEQSAMLEAIQQSGMVLFFLSESYAKDECLMLDIFAYAATVARKPFISIWLDSFEDIQNSFRDEQSDKQLFSTLEMLTAKNFGIPTSRVITALEQYELIETPYIPSTPQICEKPCEAYDGDEPYIFVSYAHDDAHKVYPIIKEIYEAGWDLWYDEGIKITERYLPVIAHHVSRCSTLVLMLTNRCIERPFVMDYELEYAVRRGIPIIPVLIEELTTLLRMQENASRLQTMSIMPDKLSDYIKLARANLTNHGERVAVAPAVKQNMIYDIILPPELPGFEYAMSDNEITILKYVGTEQNVVIPGVVSVDNEMVFPVTTIGEYAFCDCHSVIHIDIGDGVKYIKQGAFWGCENLQSIDIPISVVEIGGSVFWECKSLKKVDIPNNLEEMGSSAFSGCESLDYLLIPDKIAYEGNFFSGCHKLRAVFNASMTTVFHYNRYDDAISYSIPDTVEVIESSAFIGCKNLKEVHIPDSVKYIGRLAFSGCESLECVTIPHRVSCIGMYAFSSCISLKTVNILDGVKCIADSMFYNCVALRDIFIPNSVIAIERGAFSSCESLVSVHLPDSLLSIGHDAFGGCKSLERIKIPASVIEFGVGVFDDCVNLGLILDESETTIINYPKKKQVTFNDIPKSVNAIGNDAFSGNCKVKNLIIPDSITDIKPYAFSHCESLTSFQLPQGITTIAKGLFSNCNSLMSVAIPKNITAIGDHAFSNCASLETIHLPDSILRIENGAFSCCESLKEIDLPQKLSSISEALFAQCKSLTSVTIPHGVVKIEEDAFLCCISLKTIALPQSIEKIEKMAFGCCESLSHISMANTQADIADSAFSNTPIEADMAKIRLQNRACTTKLLHSHDFTELKCSEKPKALVLCEDIDLIDIKELLAELFWEGFNLCYEREISQSAIDESQCILVFFSENTGKSDDKILHHIKQTVFHDPSRIIQVFIGNCLDWPDDIRNQLYDRQAVFQKNHSPNEFAGKIRDSLRRFDCCGNHPRGFEVIRLENSAGIAKFNSTDLPLVVIPKTFFDPPLAVTSIRRFAFEYCKSIVRIILPDSVTSIDHMAFFDCTSLIEINIPNGVLSIGDNAFTGCESLSSITIPESVNSIGDSAFSGCKSLMSLTMQEGITTICKGAFGYCELLKTVILPNSLVSLGDEVFERCYSLTSITIPDNVKHIGDSVFSKCDSALTIYANQNGVGWKYAEENGIKHEQICTLSEE